MNFVFWEDLDLWKQFLDDKWKIIYHELYENYKEIIEKAISQY